MTKKVVIFTNYRTGSTAFTLLKSEEYNLPYAAELFCHSRQNSIGRIPSRHVLQHGYKIYAYEILDMIQSKANFIAELNMPATEACFKVMPLQVDTLQDNIDIANACDKVYFLYSRDFIRTVKSYIAVRVTGSFGHTGFITKSNAYTVEHAREQVLGILGEEKTFREKIDVNDPILTGLIGNVTIPKLRQAIIDNYERMADLYHTIGGELICKEDYFSGDRYRPYNKEVIWSEEVNIEDYDVESLFTIDKRQKV